MLEEKFQHYPESAEDRRMYLPVIRFLSRRVPALIKFSLYIGMTYLVLIAGVEPCQGQGCDYWVRKGNCSGAAPKCNTYYTCYSGDSSCSNCQDSDARNYCWGLGCSFSGWSSCGCYVAPNPDTLTVSGSVSCVASGGGGWCRGGATLTLTATDSQSHAVNILGTIGVGSFNCGTSNPCYQGLPEGQGSITYHATCTGGQITPTYTDSWKLDLTPPTVNYGLTGGVLGVGGWYLSGPVTMNCTGSDGLSGLQGITYGQQTANGDGVHALSCTASDVAGNTADAYAAVSIDGTAPSISAAVSGGTPGNGGWYLSGPVSMVCTASDATSGVSAVTYGAMTATATGTTNLNCTAYDNAGNSSSYSTNVSIDNIAPGGTFAYDGSYCSGGWYNTPVRVSLQASDGQSGPAGSSLQINGNEWPSNQKVGEGVYMVTGTVWDVAGNSASVSDVLRVDITPPVSAWSVEDGVWVGGKVQLEGSSTDLTSGISKVEISLDGGQTWMEIGKDEVWTFEWDTLDPDATVPDGEYELLARAKDNACNQEHTGRVTVRVDNTPPDLTLKDSVNLMGRNTTVIATDAGSGVDHGAATISGNGIEPRRIPFSAGETQIAWDGMTGDGKKAPFGIYDIVVEVWDVVGNYSTTKGTWVRPAPVKATDVPPENNININPDNPSGPAENRNEGVKAAVGGAVVGLPFWSLVLPIGALGVWLAASNAALAGDRRWSELRGIRDTVGRYRDQKKTNFPQGEEEE
jgi:hypothetical protein